MHDNNSQSVEVTKMKQWRRVFSRSLSWRYYIASDLQHFASRMGQETYYYQHPE